MGTLYYGDNLDILRRYIKDNTVDLVYLDPPFNSAQNYAFFQEKARPVEQKKGADHGVDGKILFRDDPKAAKPEQIIIQVKGGKTGVKDVRDLRGVIEREKQPSASSFHSSHRLARWTPKPPAPASMNTKQIRRSSPVSNSAP